MNFFINSPAYYTNRHGVVTDIYNLCDYISKNIDVTNYTNKLDTIGIVPIIVPRQEIYGDQWNEEIYVSISTRIASISLHSSYEDYWLTDTNGRKKIIIDNIIQSLNAIKAKLKCDFNLDQMVFDVIECTNKFEGKYNF